MNDPLFILPIELWENILSRLPYRDRANASVANKNWRQLCCSVAIRKSLHVAIPREDSDLFLRGLRSWNRTLSSINLYGSWFGAALLERIGQSVGRLKELRIMTNYPHLTPLEDIDCLRSFEHGILHLTLGGVQVIHGVGDVPHLEALTLCGVHDVDLQGLEGCTGVTSLRLNDATPLRLEGVEHCPSLCAFSIEYFMGEPGGVVLDFSPLSVCADLTRVSLECVGAPSLGFLAAAPNLQVLHLHALETPSLSVLSDCRSLTHLQLSVLPPHETVPSLSTLTQLSYVSFSQVAGATPSTLGFGQTLKDFSAKDSPFTDLQCIEKCTKLETVSVCSSGLTASLLHDISTLAVCGQYLRSLDISFSAVHDLGPIRHCSHLTRLCASSTLIPTVAPLEGLSTLRVLQAINCVHLADISALAACPTLRVVDISCCQLINNITPLGYCSNLRVLKANQCQLSEIAPLGACTQLSVLELHRTFVTHLFPLHRLPHLRVLNVARTSILTLTPLSACTALRHLQLENTDIYDISPLSKCTELRHLDISGTLVRSVDALASCRQLTTLLLWHAPTDSVPPLPLCSVHGLGTGPHMQNHYDESMEDAEE